MTRFAFVKKKKEKKKGKKVVTANGIRAVSLWVC
jgi:hypothetical protein